MFYSPIENFLKEGGGPLNFLFFLNQLKISNHILSLFLDSFACDVWFSIYPIIIGIVITTITVTDWGYTVTQFSE